MALYDRGQIRLDSTLNYYFDDLDKNAGGKKVRNSKLNYISLRELLTHRSGLPEGLPVGLFINPLKALEMIRIQQEKQALADSMNADEEANVYEVIDTNLLKASSDSLLKYIYGKEKDKIYNIEIAENMWMRESIADSLWQLAKQSWMRKGKKYLYSDLNMYLAMKVAEKVSGKKLNEFLREVFFGPMNLGHICFYPRKYNKKENIVPTEDEQYFRKQLIRGYVHDPLAAIAGGNGGNAGLFSNAGDLGVLMQMLLNGGSYGGRQYLKEGTIQLFVKTQDGGWRGLGFDRKGGTESKMVAGGASPKTYGHTGFSGTCVWVDPEYAMVFVFLSNRIHPKSSNQKINSLRVRQNVQQLIYEAVIF
jgi:CubicO group peptidase (beta-lactamase class C family)